VENCLALDINALCHYGYSLWKDKKHVEGAERILRRVLASDPSLPVRALLQSVPVCCSVFQCVGRAAAKGQVDESCQSNKNGQKTTQQFLSLPVLKSEKFEVKTLGFRV
jgi:hypothetical protein